MEFSVLNKNAGLLVAKVSDEDGDLAERRWHLSGGKVIAGQPGRYLISADKKYLHRVVAHRMGLIPEVRGGGRQGQWTVSVDHINGDKLDNRRENLRLRNRHQQMTNINDGLRVNNKSGFRGVCYNKKAGGKKWHAYSSLNSKSVSLGDFSTQEEAIAARRGWDIARALLTG